MLVFVRNAVLQYMQICQARSCPSLLYLWQVGMPCRRDQYWTDILASCYPILSFSLSLLAQNLTFSQIAFTMDSLTFLRLTVCTLDSYSYHFFWACRVLFFWGGFRAFLLILYVYFCFMPKSPILVLAGLYTESLVAAASAITSRAPGIRCKGQPTQVYIENGHQMV